MADEISAALDIAVFVTVGPYPVDYLRFRDVLGRCKAIDLMEAGMDAAAALCEEKKCVAIGEIGRPHFPVDGEAREDANAILRYGMEKARDVGVPVVLHTESTTSSQCHELANMAKKSGLSVDKVVKHFAPPLIHAHENHGLMPSVLASKKNIMQALAKGSRFLMETDYIDDPRRPGAVLGPKTIPRLTRNLLTNGQMTEDQAYTIHVENPEKTYGITLGF